MASTSACRSSGRLQRLARAQLFDLVLRGVQHECSHEIVESLLFEVLDYLSLDRDRIFVIVIVLHYVSAAENHTGVILVPRLIVNRCVTPSASNVVVAGKPD